MIFVTGGTGLIGSFLIETLLAGGAAVKALYRQEIPAILAKVPPEQLTWIKGDILDTALLREIICGNVTQVYHCAGLVSYAPQDAALLKEINVTGTANIVNACLYKPGIKLCHVSSIAAIGQSKTETSLTENNHWDASVAHSLYASSKYFGELEIWRGISEGLQAVIVNPSVVLGPAADWSRSSTQLFKYVSDENRFYTAGSANFVDVRDVANIMVAVMAAGISGERFIINAGALTYKSFFSQVASCLHKKEPSVEVPGILMEVLWRAEWIKALLTGKKPLITKETARIAEKKQVYSNKKIKTWLNYEFIPLEETIKWCCQELKQRQTS